MFNFLTSCFKGVHRESPFDDKSLKDSTTHLPSCIFCHVSPQNGFQVVYEDEHYIAFKDHNPSAEHHLLIIPRKHIGSVKSLGQNDIKLVKEMETIGHARLDDLGVPPMQRRMGFHIPPFNSVDHLHLHVLGLPFRNWYIGAKYRYIPGSNGHAKGNTWFADVGQTIRILENGNKVSVTSC